MEERALRIVLTGAAGRIGSILAGLIADGCMLKGRKLHLVLCERAENTEKAEGVALETEDIPSDCLEAVEVISDLETAFKGVDIAILCGSVPRGPAMNRAELLKANVAIYVEVGKALQNVARPDAKILVVANPVNTNAYVIRHFAPKLGRNITALTLLDHTRAVAMLAKEFDKPLSAVRGVHVWGNHSVNVCVDLSHAKIAGTPLRELREQAEVCSLVVKHRGGKIIEKTGATSCFSAALAILDHVEAWVRGKGQQLVMGVFHEDLVRAIPEHVNFCRPVVCADGDWHALEVEPPSEGVMMELQTNLLEILEEVREAEDAIVELEGEEQLKRLARLRRGRSSLF